MLFLFVDCSFSVGGLCLLICFAFAFAFRVWVACRFTLFGCWFVATFVEFVGGFSECVCCFDWFIYLTLIDHVLNCWFARCYCCL